MPVEVIELFEEYRSQLITRNIDWSSGRDVAVIILNEVEDIIKEGE